MLFLGEDGGSRLDDGKAIKAGLDDSCAPSQEVDSRLPSPNVDNTPIASAAQATAEQCAATAATDHVEDGAELVHVKSCAVTTSEKCAPACA